MANCSATCSGTPDDGCDQPVPVYAIYGKATSTTLVTASPSGTSVAEATVHIHRNMAVWVSAAIALPLIVLAFTLVICFNMRNARRLGALDSPDMMEIDRPLDPEDPHSYIPDLLYAQPTAPPCKVDVDEVPPYDGDLGMSASRIHASSLTETGVLPNCHASTASMPPTSNGSKQNHSIPKRGGVTGPETGRSPVI